MRVLGGQSTPLKYDVPTELVALILSEPPDQPPGTTWDVFVDVAIGEGGFSRLGAVRSGAVAARLAPQRVIAVAACPGARAWRATVVTATAAATCEFFFAGESGTRLERPSGGVFPINPAGGAAVDASVIPW